MITESDSFAILDQFLDAAQTDEADAALILSDGNISRFANSNVHQNMSEVSLEVMLRVVSGASMGVATTTSLDPDDIAATAALAREAARHADPLPRYSGLYRDAEPIPDLPACDRRTAEIAPLAKAESLREMFDRGRADGVSFAGTFNTGSTLVSCANSHGVRRSALMTNAEATVIAMRNGASGYATACARAVDEVGIQSLATDATLKATLQVGQEAEIPPGSYDVILEPPALAEVFEWLSIIAFTGHSFEEESSLLCGNLGQRIMGENITIADDAVDPAFLPFPFDLEGLPKRRVVLIENGIARTPVVDKAYADRLGITPTANAWQLGSSDHGTALHLSMEGGDSTRDDMIRSTKLGIWVTRFNYVNGLLEPKTALMTGTTRDGTFLIRDGQVAGRLPNLRWTQSMVEALSNVESLSRERSRVGAWFNMFGGSLAPVVKIKGWNFTGQQESMREEG